MNVYVLSTNAQQAEALSSVRTQVIQEKKARETTSKRFSELQEQKTTIDTSLKEERLKSEQIQQENESLKVNLQAKKQRQAEAAQLAAAQTTQTPVAPTQASPRATVAVTGSKADWLAASGIPSHEWGYVDSIVTRESGWNPNAVNPTSGACGLGQQLPCGKWAGAWNDPVAALRAQYGYVVERYGSYAGAVAFWNANHWY